MPDNQVEDKNLKPQTQTPDTSPTQAASSVETSEKTLTPAEEAGKTIIDETVQKLNEKQKRAERKLDEKRREVVVPEQQQVVEQKIEAIVQDPAKNNVSFLVETGEKPQDKDLQIIVCDITQRLADNEHLFESEASVPLLDQWMLMLKAAEKNKPDEARAELRKYRERLAEKIKEIAVEKGRREDEQSDLSEDQKKTREGIRRTSGKRWEKILVDEDVDVEQVFLAIQKARGAAAGGSGAPGGPTGSGTPPPAPPPGGSGGGAGSTGGSGGGGGRSGTGGTSGTGSRGPGGGGTPPEWEVFSESDPEFRRLPSDFQQFIRDVNADVVHSPRSITKHYLEGLNSDLRRFGTAPMTIKDELRRNINAKIEEVENSERLGREAQRAAEASAREAQEVERTKATLNQRFEASLNGERAHQALGYSRKDVFFLDYILSNPKNVEAFIKGENFGEALQTIEGQASTSAGTPIVDTSDPNALSRRDFVDYMDFETKRGDKAKNYELFKKYVRRVYDHLFDAAAINRLAQFRESEDPFVHKPIKNQIYSNLQILSRYFSRQENYIKVGETVKYDYLHNVNGVDYLPNKVHLDPEINLGEALGQFSSRLNKESDLREYNHNIGFILGAKRNLEELAGFASQLDASQIDTLFLEDENQILQTAYRFYIQELKKASADNFWMMSTTWLSEDPQGKIAIEENVKNSLLQLDQSLTERDVNRIISMVSGMAFGITGEGFDILAQNQPPHRDGYRGFAGYFGDNILHYWNMQHNFQRWGTPNHIPQLMYIKIMQGGRFGKFWDYKELETVMKHDMNLLKTGLTWSLSGGPPMIDVASRIFGIKGVLGRGSWRIQALTSHHLEPIRAGLPILRRPYDAKWDQNQAEKWAIDSLIGENIDWEKSFKNLEQAGVGVMLSYWIDRRIKFDPNYKKAEAEAHAHGHSGHGGGHGHDDPRKEFAYKEYLNKIRGRNPLVFLRYDLSQEFKNSLRYQVLGHIDKFRGERNNYENIKGKVDDIERDLYLVVEKITQNKRWNVEEVDWEVIKDPGNPTREAERRELAKQYWQALQTEISRPTHEGSKPAHGSIDEIYDKFFKEDAKYYFFGSEDIDFKELAFREGGFDILKRAYNDINTLSKSVDSFFKYTEVLKASASSRDYGKIIESIHEICHPIEGIHGTEAAEQMTYYLVTMAARFFGKNTGARFPLLGGTIMGWLRTNSLSEAVFGKNAWQWDENKTAEFINAVRSHTGLITTNKHHWYNIHNLSAEVGARNWQALYDILRSAVPLILLLIMWQAIQSETRDSGGGGGGHH